MPAAAVFAFAAAFGGGRTARREHSGDRPPREQPAAEHAVCRGKVGAAARGPAAPEASFLLFGGDDRGAIHAPRDPAGLPSGMVGKRALVAGTVLRGAFRPP